jgi:hypothetical protein
LFACVVTLVLVLPAAVVVSTAWILARKIGPRWPSSLKSPTAMVLLSLAPAAVSALCVVGAVFAHVSAGTEAGLWAAIVAGVLAGGWELFLLFVTRQGLAAAPPRLLALRIWLVVCFLAAACVIVLGFALGVSQGTH